MILTDTHTHLYSEAFDEDRFVQIDQAIAAGVTRFFLPSIDSTYVDSMKELKQKYPDHIFLMAGLHPTHVKENVEEELAVVEAELAKGLYVAVGEIGIDLYWDKTFLKEQQYAFEKQIRLAQQYDLPFAIHCRDAFDEVFEVMERIGGTFKGVFHCFTGTLEQAKRAIGFGLTLGIGGVLTFKNGNLDSFIQSIPIEHIVLETDAPYLAPSPYRGKRNNPIYLLDIAQKMADCYGISLEEVAAITTKNSVQLFGV